jgi:hypothetical protein
MRLLVERRSKRSCRWPKTWLKATFSASHGIGMVIKNIPKVADGAEPSPRPRYYWSEAYAL